MQLARRLDFHDDLAGNEEVSAIGRDHPALVHDFQRQLPHIRDPPLPKFDFESTGIHAFEKAVAKFVKDVIERADDLPSHFALDQATWRELAYVVVGTIRADLHDPQDPRWLRSMRHQTPSRRT